MKFYFQTFITDDTIDESKLHMIVIMAIDNVEYNSNSPSKSIKIVKKSKYLIKTTSV